MAAMVEREMKKVDGLGGQNEEGGSSETKKNDLPEKPAQAEEGTECEKDDDFESETAAAAEKSSISVIKLHSVLLPNLTLQCTGEQQEYEDDEEMEKQDDEGVQEEKGQPSTSTLPSEEYDWSEESEEEEEIRTILNDYKDEDEDDDRSLIRKTVFRRKVTEPTAPRARSRLEEKAKEENNGFTILDLLKRRREKERERIP